MTERATKHDPRRSRVDGFSPADTGAFVGFSADTTEIFYTFVGRAGRRLGAQVAGIERLPMGRALLVANHAFGWDAMIPIAMIRAVTHRNVWALGEHAWWRFPFLRRLASSVGVVDGTRENVDRLLGQDQLVLVLPGGLREAVKPRELRYHLLWGHRYGFVSAAIRNRAPLVPLACLGADELFDFKGDAYARGRRWLGYDIPIPIPAHIVPLPHLVHLRYVVGEPIAPDVPPERADDPDALRRIRREVEGALHELIETELAFRAGIHVD